MTRSSSQQTRTAYFLDIDNLCGTGRASEAEVLTALEHFERKFAPSPDDLVFCAAVPSAAFHVKRNRPHYLVRSATGKNGADRRLLELADPHFLTRRVGHVVFGSGDGIFHAVAQQLRSCGVQVDVFARHGSLSRSLRDVAHSCQTSDFKLPSSSAA